jgi:integrase
MLQYFTHYATHAANDRLIPRERTVPIPATITAVHGYPSKLAVYKITASRYWQVRCWVAGRTHKRSTKTTSLPLAQRFARWFYEDLLVRHLAPVQISTIPTATNCSTKHRLTFGALAAQVYADEQARVDRGEFGAGSLRMFRNRLDAQVLPRFGMKLADDIDYAKLQEFCQALSVKYSTTTVSHYLIVVRKVLAHALRIGQLEQLPEFPKIKIKAASRGAFTPTEYWQLLRAARALRGVQHPDSKRDIRKKIKQAYNDHRMPPDVAWAIGFMVNSFIRPGDLVKIRHRHIELVRGSTNTYLRLTLPETKLHTAPIVTLYPAVRIYQQIQQHQVAKNRAKPNDYLFLPEIPNRNYALTVLSFMFN